LSTILVNNEWHFHFQTANETHNHKPFQIDFS
jgi:hypothetical protein